MIGPYGKTGWVIGLLTLKILRPLIVHLFDSTKLNKSRCLIGEDPHNPGYFLALLNVIGTPHSRS